MDLSVSTWIVLCLAAFFAGVTKTGVPGLIILVVVLVAMVLPPKLSTGYVLPILIFSDIMAVAYWRKSTVWKHIFALLPATFVGIIVGYFLMGVIADAAYGKVLGGLVLFMLLLDCIRRYYHIPVPENSRLVSWSLGFFAGILTMLANAAGPAMMLYLLAMNVSKERFVGTCAWLYAIINLTKVPFSMNLGLITWDSLMVNMMLVPFVVIGGIAGVIIVRGMSPESFTIVTFVLAFLGGLKMMF